jgi:hypothetical protein
MQLCITVENLGTGRIVDRLLCWVAEGRIVKTYVALDPLINLVRRQEDFVT